jgi:hypothetical protein
MPLYDNAKYLIRANLEEVQRGGKVRAVIIGDFTPAQFETINQIKASVGLPLLESPEIVFLGSHVYNSRVIRDGYSLDDVMLQIESVLVATAIVLTSPRMTAIRSTVPRQDGYGNEVLDEAVFECTQRKPRAELYSVMPKGDQIKPPKPQQ